MACCFIVRPFVQNLVKMVAIFTTYSFFTRLCPSVPHTPYNEKNDSDFLHFLREISLQDCSLISTKIRASSYGFVSQIYFAGYFEMGQGHSNVLNLEQNLQKPTGLYWYSAIYTKQ